MKPTTTATLERLAAADWFANVGFQDTNEAEVLANWPSAIASCSSAEWGSLCSEGIDRLCARVAELKPARYAEWNRVVLDLRPPALALARKKTLETSISDDLSRALLSNVVRDVLHILIEAEYADVIPPDFYAAQARWYVKGHFPCGWRGDFPAGRPVIF